MVALLSNGVHAAVNNGKQSYETCSLITSEYVTVLQLIYRGFDQAALTASLPGLSSEAKTRMHSLYQTVEREGLLETFSVVNSEYADCAANVFRLTGSPPRSGRDGHFYFCAGENKTRYQILMAALVGADADQVVPQLADQHKPAARSLFVLYREKGALPVFDALAAELKFCINNNL
ncbi:hypothetical protein [Marinobacter caseinilyticus]|uniref:hypothetical protein n=1 Tax=Marinobacter caseinilyticus TaxID=2692195 RepID=UPI0014095454|nr:hypothetical protein [Marinobacter caseinilyticus]